MKIAYYVHGRGRGHAARALQLVPKLLNAGHQVDIYASDDAMQLLAELKLYIVKRDKNAVTFVRRVLSDHRLLKHSKPDMLISDGDAPSVYAARFAGIKVISIGHGLIIPYCRHPFRIPWRAYMREGSKSIINSYFAHYRVAVHFTDIKPKSNRTIVARPDYNEESTDEKGTYYISYFRDQIGASILKELSQGGHTVHNFGYPIQLERISNHPIDQKLFRHYFLRSAGVVGTAGSNLIYEAVMLQKPLLCIYKKNDFEQMINAAYVESESLGLALEETKIDASAIDNFLKLDTHPVNRTTVRQLPQLSDTVIELLSNQERSFSN